MNYFTHFRDPVRGLAGWPYRIYYTPIGGSFIILTGLYYRLTPVLSNSPSLTAKAFLTKQADSVTISSIYIYIFFCLWPATLTVCFCFFWEREDTQSRSQLHFRSKYFERVGSGHWLISLDINIHISKWFELVRSCARTPFKIRCELVLPSSSNGPSPSVLPKDKPKKDTERFGQFSKTTEERTGKRQGWKRGFQDVGAGGCHQRLLLLVGMKDFFVAHLFG